jgi:hypothetical protein
MIFIETALNMSNTGWNSITLENEVVYSEGYITRVGATKNGSEN